MTRPSATSWLARRAGAAGRGRAPAARCSSRSPSACCSPLGVIVGAAPSTTSRSRGGSLPGALFLAVDPRCCSRCGMYRCRYWAVLGFEALLAFQIIVTSLALVVASTVPAAAVCLVEHRPRRVAVLEARPRDGTHPGRRTTPHQGFDGLGQRFDRLSRMAETPTTASSSAPGRAATSPRSAPLSSARRPPWSSATRSAGAA